MASNQHAEILGDEGLLVPGGQLPTTVHIMDITGWTKLGLSQEFSIQSQGGNNNPKSINLAQGAGHCLNNWTTQHHPNCHSKQRVNEPSKRKIKVESFKGTIKTRKLMIPSAQNQLIKSKTSQKVFF